MEKYEGSGTIIFNQSVSMESQSVTVSIENNSKEITTMKKDLAGFAKGVVKSSIKVENAVPSSGLEEDYVGLCVEMAFVKIVYVSAGKRYSFEGVIQSVEGSTGTDNPSSFSYTVTAGRPTVL